MRTESKTMQVHPSDEQYYINLLQEFHWNLKSSQEVKTKDSHLETRDGELYNVTESEHYVKLIFERPYDFPNRDQIVKLEDEYFGLNYPLTDSYNSAIWITLIAVVVLSIMGKTIFAILVLLGGGYWIYSINTGNTKKRQKCAENNSRRQVILAQAQQLESSF